MRPLILFYILVLYVLIQFSWWSYLLVDLNTEIYHQKIDVLKSLSPQTEVYLQQEAILEKEMHKRWLMVVGEGFVFLLLLIAGLIFIRQSFTKELQLSRQQKNFMMSITHEFKSPLAAIKLSLQTLLRRKVDEQTQQQIMKRAVFETDRINALVENILMAARIESINLEFNMTEFNLSEAIKSLTQSGEFSLANGKKLETHIEDNIYMSGDALAISSLFMNLLENADKYSPENSVITVRLHQTEKELFLSVEDQGIGIPLNERRKIFEKFYRIGAEETRKTKGTGLGLYIARFIALKHKATLSVSDNQPKGSIFKIAFPRTI
ncbi:MAG TPA: ATP-binding protein [Bacteroidia bacterium]|nr:ATP-binding protein [Bacteroidia bacterium]HNU34580.1 ATP-binding protein [Bacteroidia bacterium]